jgi:hypothetical protein
LSTGRGIRGDFTTPLLLAAVIGYSLVTGHRGINRVLLAGAVLWFLGAAAPVPLAAGDHATESRFFYLPSLPVSLVAAVLLLPLLRNTRGHLILAAWIAGLIATRISTLNDPAALWLVLAGFILVLPVGYVCRAVSPATVARAAALALAPQIAIYCGQSLYYLPALLIIAALPRRRVAWCLAALIAWNWDCRAAFVAGVFLTVLESRRFEAFYQRVTARMERNLEPEFAVAQ